MSRRSSLAAGPHGSLSPCPSTRAPFLLFRRWHLTYAEHLIIAAFITAQVQVFRLVIHPLAVLGLPVAARVAAVAVYSPYSSIQPSLLSFWTNAAVVAAWREASWSPFSTSWPQLAVLAVAMTFLRLIQ